MCDVRRCESQNEVVSEPVTATHHLLSILPTDRYLSEATVMRLTGWTRRRVVQHMALLRELRCVDTATVQHTGIGRAMRIYRRVA